MVLETTQAPPLSPPRGPMDPPPPGVSAKPRRPPPSPLRRENTTQHPGKSSLSVRPTPPGVPGPLGDPPCGVSTALPHGGSHGPGPTAPSPLPGWGPWAGGWPSESGVQLLQVQEAPARARWDGPGAARQSRPVTVCETPHPLNGRLCKRPELWKINGKGKRSEMSQNARKHAERESHTLLRGEGGV